jgi:zinc-ribbon domain
MAFCAKCGSELTPGAAFCSKCGTPVTVAAPPRVPPPARPPASSGEVPARRSGWWIAPLVVVGLVVLAFALLMILPLDRDKPRVAAKVPATETIAEGPPAVGTTTLVEMEGPADDSFEISTTTTQAPPMPVPTVTTPATATGAPVIVEEPAAQPQPRPQPRPPVRTQPQPRTQPPPRAEPRTEPRDVPPPVRVAPRPSPELTSSQATAVLRSYITQTNYYRKGSDCLRVENRGYRNIGYDLEVWDTCAGSGSRRLDRWRVDSKTREVFRQRDDGRYLRP